MCVIEVLDRLELYNDLVLHDEVETMATDLLLPEQDANELFSLKRDPAEPQRGLSALHAGDLPKFRSSRP